MYEVLTVVLGMYQKLCVSCYYYVDIIVIIAYVKMGQTKGLPSKMVQGREFFGTKRPTQIFLIL